MKGTGFSVSSIGIALGVICAAAGVIVFTLTGYAAAIVAGALLGFYFVLAIQVADQWQRVAVLRLGRFVGMRGPGVFHIVPIVDNLSRFVDQRVRVRT